MNKSKIFDCITFFDNNFMFNFRYNVLKNYVDYFIICESKYNHKGLIKNKNLFGKRILTKKNQIFFEEPFPENNDPWKNRFQKNFY